MDFKTQIKSTVATGTAPLSIASTTAVSNLNADLLDGNHASAFALAHTHPYLPLAGGTMTGNILFSDSALVKRGLQGTVGGNDFWFIGGGATASNAGFLEISTGDDGQGSGTSEPIYVRQYGPGDPLTGTLVRTASLLDASGNTSFPGTITGTQLISTITNGTAPFTVTSTTKVSNLNVDRLDDMHADIAGTASTIAARDASGNLTVADTYNFGTAADIKYNSTTKSIDFIFA